MRWSPSISAVAVLLVFTSPSQAAAILQLYSGTGIVTVADNSAADTDPAVGAVSFAGNVGATVFADVKGSGLGSTGSASSPKLRLSGSATPLVAGVQLTIFFTDTNYAPTFLTYFSFSTAGVQDGSIDIVAASAQTNLPFDLQLPVGSFATSSPGAFSYSSTQAGSSATQYSLTELVVMRPASKTTFDVEVQAIDEPSTSAIWIGAVLLAACLRMGVTSRQS